MGYLVLLNVRNQDGGNSNATVSDVTFRLIKVVNGAGGIQFLVHDDPNASQNMQRVLVENNLFDRICSMASSPFPSCPTAWSNGTNGRLWAFGSYSQTAPPPNAAQDMVFDHNTAFPDQSPTDAQDSSNQVFLPPPPPNEFRNNLMNGGLYGVRSDFFAEGTDTLTFCFNSVPFNRNAVIGRASTVYPANNFFPATVDEVQFVNYAGGNYRLEPTSPLKNRGTDGLDVGANIDLLDTATAGTISGVW